MDDPRAGAEFMADARHAHILRSGVDIDLVSLARQLGAEVADVHIHAARFFAAEGSQRAGVHA